MMELKANTIVYDVGSTYTKAAAFRHERGEFTYLGRGQSPTTLEHVPDGAANARAMIEASGVLFEPETKSYSSCSAAGGLRMVALGFMPRVTARAAKEVSMTAGARVMQVVSADEPLDFREEALCEIDPDIILLSGGTDDGDESSALENARMICGVHGKGTVIVACNTGAQRKVAEMFDRAGVKYVRVPNIMPTIHELNVERAREAIHEQFIAQITKAKGLDEFCATLADGKVIPTPGVVLQASELLAKGFYEEEGAGPLILIDIGGATTDIHSILPNMEALPIEEKGLVVTNAKQLSYRTVEGNLGLRVSATGIVQTAGVNALLSFVDPSLGVKGDFLEEFAARLEDDPEYIPSTDVERAVERAMALCAIKIALRRHAGHFAQESDPVLGTMAGAAVGRDLREVGTVICVGGIFVHSGQGMRDEIVRRCFEDTGISLLPPHPPRVVLDSDYLMFAMGVLGHRYPEAALKFMKRYIGA